jgi:hypothetical protein
MIHRRGNWTFFGSDTGGKTAAVLRSFIASCKRSGIEPFAWSATCSRAFRRTPLPGSVNCFRTTGNWRLPLPKLKQSADTTSRIIPGRAVHETC